MDLIGAFIILYSFFFIHYSIIANLYPNNPPLRKDSRMKNEIKDYITEIKQKISTGDVTENLAEEMLIRIGFYQHERLVHLIVTMTFATMTVISFFMLASAASLLTVGLSLLFLALTVPYVMHYYFLENSVQEMYRLYYEVKRLIKK